MTNVHSNSIAAIGLPPTITIGSFIPLFISTIMHQNNFDCFHSSRYLNLNYYCYFSFIELVTLVFVFIFLLPFVDICSKLATDIPKITLLFSSSIIGDLNSNYKLHFLSGFDQTMSPIVAKFVKYYQNKSTLLLLVTFAIMHNLAIEPNQTQATEPEPPKVPICHSPIDLSVAADVGWLETVVFANFRIWHVMFSGMAIGIAVTVVLCCLFRCRIPRTKQEIEADFIRKRITKSFRSHLNQIKLEELDPTNLLPVFQKVEVLEEDRVGKNFEERHLNWRQKIKRYIFGSKDQSYEEEIGKEGEDSKEPSAEYKKMTKEEMEKVEDAVGGAKMELTAFDMINDQIAVLSYFESSKERKKRIKQEKQLEKALKKEQKEFEKLQKKEAKQDKDGKLNGKELSELRADYLETLQNGAKRSKKEFKLEKKEDKPSSAEEAESKELEEIENLKEGDDEVFQETPSCPEIKDTMEEKGYQEISIPMPQSSLPENDEVEIPVKKGFGFSFRNTVQKLMGKTFLGGGGGSGSKKSSIVESKNVVRDEMVINIELVKQSPTKSQIIPPTIPQIECPPEDEKLSKKGRKHHQKMKRPKDSKTSKEQESIDPNLLQIPEITKSTKEINEQRRDSISESIERDTKLNSKQLKKKEKLDKKEMKKLKKSEEKERKLQEKKSTSKHRLSIEEKRHLLQKQQKTEEEIGRKEMDDTDDIDADEFEPDSVSVVTIKKAPEDKSAAARKLKKEKEKELKRQAKEMKQKEKQRFKEAAKAAALEAKKRSAKGSSPIGSVQSTPTTETTRSTPTDSKIEPIIVKPTESKSKKSKIKKEVKIVLEPEKEVYIPKESKSIKSEPSKSRTSESKAKLCHSKDRGEKSTKSKEHDQKSSPKVPVTTIPQPQPSPSIPTKFDFSEVVDLALKEKKPKPRLKRDVQTSTTRDESATVSKDTLKRHSKTHRHHESGRSTLTRQKSTGISKPTSKDSAEQQKQNFNQLVLHLNEELKQKFADQQKQKSQLLQRSQTVDDECLGLIESDEEDEFRLKNRNEFKKRLSEVLLQKMTATSMRIQLDDKPPKDQITASKSLLSSRKSLTRPEKAPPSPPGPPTIVKPLSKDIQRLKGAHHKMSKQGTSSSELEIPVEHLYTGAETSVEVHQFPTDDKLAIVKFVQPSTSRSQIQSEHSNIVEKFTDKSPTGENRELKITRTRDVTINVDPGVYLHKSRQPTEAPKQTSSAEAIIQSESIVVDPSRTFRPKISRSTPKPSSELSSTSSLRVERHRAREKHKSSRSESSTLEKSHRKTKDAATETKTMKSHHSSRHPDKEKK